MRFARGLRVVAACAAVLAGFATIPGAVLAGFATPDLARRAGAAPLTSSPWPSMRHDVDNSGRSPLAADYRGDRPWSFRTGRGLFITPVIGGDGAIYFGSADGNFYALNANGRLRWKLSTGNIIDAAAALDSTQRSVTIGSADQYLYHLSTARHPRRRVIWRYRAVLPPVAGQLVDWWEDDIAYGPDGNVYTGNTGGVVYSFTPSGRLRWTFRAGNSVWTMPAFGPGGVTYWGSVDRNVYALDRSGKDLWSRPTLGFVISSPAIGSDGTIYIGSFDSHLYALDPATGKPKWMFGTNDHIYSSPALGADARGRTDAIFIASTDGSVYALRPSGRLMWSYDTGEAIRSSPVLGAGPRGKGQILYVGSSDGSLYALDAATGRRRWSFDTVSSDPILRDRHQLNSSPALGRTGVYIGSEDGSLWYVPYDYCLHRPDPRCDTDPGEPYPARMTAILPVSAGGTTIRFGAEGPVPSSSVIVARLIVRREGRTVYAAMLPRPLVRATPSFPFTTQLSGDGRYIFIVPKSFLKAGATYRIEVSGRWGASGKRVADWTLPGTWRRFGRFAGSFTVRTASARAPLPLMARAGRVSVFELRRLAMPLPAFLPSVNQIGFDSYVLLVGAIRIGKPDRSGRGSVLLWATQARRGVRGGYVPDPHGTLVFPLAGSYRADSLMLSTRRAVLTFSFGQVPLTRLDFGFQLPGSLETAPGSSIYAQAACAQIPNYGRASFYAGICNEQGNLAASGTFLTSPHPAARAPRGLSVRSVSVSSPSALASGSVTVRFAVAHGAHYPASEHRIGLLLVDRFGHPLGLDYTDQRTFVDRYGNIATVTLAIPPGAPFDAHGTLYVISDVYPLYSTRLR